MPSDRGLHTHSPGDPHFFEPCDDPLIFVANALEMKGKDALGIGHRVACAGSTVIQACHLLHSLQIVQTLLLSLFCRPKRDQSIHKLQAIVNIANCGLFLLLHSTIILRV